MQKITQHFAICVCLCLVQNQYVDAVVKSIEKLHDYPQTQVKLLRQSFQKGNLVYAVCENEGKRINCMIIQERYPDGQLQHSCNISLGLSQEKAKFTEKWYVSPFGQDKAILFWNEIEPAKLFKLFTVNMISCETGGFDLPDANMNIYNQLYPGPKIVTYDNVFEIFTKNSIFNTVSVMTVNSHGVMERIAAEFMKIGNHSLRYMLPLDENLPNSAYVYSKRINNTEIIAIRNVNGSEKVLTTYEYNNTHIFSSINNNLVTLCVNTTKMCAQYDKEGEVKFNATLDHLKEKDTAMRDLYNLPGGGFLTIIGEYSKSEDTNPIFKPLVYVVIKINREGKKVGSLRLNEFVSAHNRAMCMMNTYSWENGNEEYCSAMVTQGTNRTSCEDAPNDVNVVVNCYADSDLY